MVETATSLYLIKNYKSLKLFMFENTFMDDFFMSLFQDEGSRFTYSKLISINESNCLL